MHTNSILLFRKFVLPLLSPGMRVLEVGPDDFPSTYFKEASTVPNLTWETIDLHENDLLSHRAKSEYEFPLEDGAFEIVLSGQVIEHVRKPWRWLQELSRVTAQGGHVITIGPVSWPYHEAPVDCWRVYPEGMKALYEDAGLETALSWWGSFENPGFKRYVPGRSRECIPPKLRFASELLGRLGFPVERSYDTVMVGVKQQDLPRTDSLVRCDS
jgi:SAM-dependent methyltransferase